MRVISSNDNESLLKIDLFKYSPNSLLHRESFVKRAIRIIVVMRVVDSSTYVKENTSFEYIAKLLKFFLRIFINLDASIYFAL